MIVFSLAACVTVLGTMEDALLEQLGATVFLVDGRFSFSAS